MVPQPNQPPLPPLCVNVGSQVKVIAAPIAQSQLMTSLSVAVRHVSPVQSMVGQIGQNGIGHGVVVVDDVVDVSGVILARHLHSVPQRPVVVVLVVTDVLLVG